MEETKKKITPMKRFWKALKLTVKSVFGKYIPGLILRVWNILVSTVSSIGDLIKFTVTYLDELTTKDAETLAYECR